MKKEVIVNERYPHYLYLERMEYPSHPFAEGVVKRMLYEGRCRSYTDTTTTGDGKVVSNRRKLSVPRRFDEWPEAVLPGDSVRVVIGSIEESGIVTDFETDNNRSVVYWDYRRE